MSSRVVAAQGVGNNHRRTSSASKAGHTPIKQVHQQTSRPHHQHRVSELHHPSTKDTTFGTTTGVNGNKHRTKPGQRTAPSFNKGHYFRDNNRCQRQQASNKTGSANCTVLQQRTLLSGQQQVSTIKSTSTSIEQVGGEELYHPSPTSPTKSTTTSTFVASRLCNAKNIESETITTLQTSSPVNFSSSPPPPGHQTASSIRTLLSTKITGTKWHQA